VRLYLGQGGSGFMQAGLGSNLNVGDGGRFWVKLRADMDFSKSMMPTEGLAHSLDSGSVVSMHYDLGKVEDGSEGGISAGSDTKVTSDLALDVPRLAKACQEAVANWSFSYTLPFYHDYTCGVSRATRENLKPTEPL